MPSQVKIKKPTTVYEVAELVQVSVNNGQRDVLAPERLDEKTSYILAFKGEKVVGGVGAILYDSKAEIDILTAEESFKNQGLEDLLLQRMLADLAKLRIRTVGAIVEDGDIELYARNGFRHDPKDLDYMVHRS